MLRDYGVVTDAKADVSHLILKHADGILREEDCRDLSRSVAVLAC